MLVFRFVDFDSMLRLMHLSQQFCVAVRRSICYTKRALDADESILDVLADELLGGSPPSTRLLILTQSSLTVPFVIKRDRSTSIYLHGVLVMREETHYDLDGGVPIPEVASIVPMLFALLSETANKIKR